MTVQQAFDLAMSHHNAGDLATAEAIYRQILTAFPNHFDSWNNLAVSHHQRRQWQPAMAAFEQALRLQPNSAMVLTNRGECLRQQRRLDLAIADLERATSLAPDSPDAWYNLGTVLDDAGSREKAIAALQRAVELRPAHVLSHLNLGATLLGLDRYSEGVVALEEALRLDPGCVSAVNNLGHAALKMGEVDRAIEWFERAVEQTNGRDLVFVSNALLARHYRDELDPVDLFTAHKRFAGFTAALPKATLPPIDRNPGRKLRIAYLSADFCGHSVAFFIEPILRHHNRDAFDLVCYDDLGASDETADRLHSIPANWLNISPLSDGELTARIIHDRIDVLIDLSGHAGRNRMGVFARRVAPIQVTYLGYPDTTGLPTMDYRLTDAIADPPGVGDEWHTEKLIRLPRTAWCYSPPMRDVQPAPSPVQQNGYITFGCFNAIAKINPPLISAWCEILERVKNAKLVLKNAGFNEQSARQRILALFERFGVRPNRVDLRGFSKHHADHFHAYDDIDVALDTYPYHGTTTTCDALWMGVPVVTRVGNLHVSRVGASLLTAVGLTDWITDSFESYTDRALRAATEPPTAADRLRFRADMTNSPLMNGAELTEAIEWAYRDMWKTFIQSPT